MPKECESRLSRCGPKSAYCSDGFAHRSGKPDAVHKGTQSNHRRHTVGCKYGLAAIQVDKLQLHLQDCQRLCPVEPARLCIFTYDFGSAEYKSLRVVVDERSS